MRSHLLLALFFCVLNAIPQCPEAPKQPADRRSNKKYLTVSSFNAEWLFLAGEGKSTCPGTGCPWKDATMANQHLKNVAGVLKQINADIINIVEVQNCNVLKKLNDELKGMNYLPYLVQGTDTATGQNVGILTRVDPIQNLQRTDSRVEYPVAGSKCNYKGTPGNTGVSKHFYTQFKVEGMSNPLVLIGLHFLAFPDDVSRCVQREAQATVIRRLADGFTGSNVIVLGDVNDFDPTVQDAADSVPISGVLNILKSTSLINMAAEIKDVSQRYSCWYDANSNCKVDPHELTMIDHLLVSKDLKLSITSAEYFHGYNASCNGLISDHWPVVVTLDLS